MIELDREQEALRSKFTTDRAFHGEIVAMVRDRFSYSYRHMQSRYSQWRKAERQHLAYVDPNEVDKSGQQIFTQARDIVVPYTYAVLQTRLTFFFFSMLSKTPLVPISGRGPNDFVPAKLMEVVQDHQMSETKAAAILYCFLQDAERYGFGVVRNVWSAIEEEKWTIRKKPYSFLGFKLTERLIRERIRTVVYEGNLPSNISPYNFFPDPRCNVADVKKYEYWGHVAIRSYNYLKMAEAVGDYFNIDRIPLIQKDNQNKTFEMDKVSTDSDLAKIVNSDSIGNMVSDPATNGSSDAANIKLKELEIRLIPKDHELSDRDYPQEWIITLANDQEIIKCEPLIYPEFSCYVGECNHDYAAPSNLSTVTMLDGLQEQLSWLFNSHMANVRKVVNDSLIVDPSLIEIKDLLKPAPVKIIRVKEAGWGNPNAINSGIKQLTVNDITRGHIQDSQIVMNLIQRVSAATDNIMGMVEEVRRTATETSSTINLATARLKLTAYLYYTIAVRPLFKAQVANNQGLLTEARYYKITDEIAQSLGYNPEDIKNRIMVEPENLYGNFDFDIPAIDMPIDKVNMAKMWREIIADVVNNPMLQQRFDILPMFKQMIYNMGITNIRDFEVKTKVMPDEQVAQMAASGSLAPLNEVAQISHEQQMDKLRELSGSMQ